VYETILDQSAHVYKTIVDRSAHVYKTIVDRSAHVYETIVDRSAHVYETIVDRSAHVYKTIVDRSAHVYETIVDIHLQDLRRTGRIFVIKIRNNRKVSEAERQSLAAVVSGVRGFLLVIFTMKRTYLTKRQLPIT
jgi:predicted transcriptional regulator